MAAGVFNDDFASCMDKMVPELDEYFKSYLVQKVNQGHMCLNLVLMSNIGEYLKWGNEIFILNEDPATIEFRTYEVTELIRQKRLIQCM